MTRILFFFLLENKLQRI